MKLAKIKIETYGGGPVAVHNYPCPAFWETESAVLNLSDGCFHPSWHAQRLGYRLVRARSWFQKLLLRWFFDG